MVDHPVVQGQSERSIEKKTERKRGESGERGNVFYLFIGAQGNGTIEKGERGPWVLHVHAYILD